MDEMKLFYSICFILFISLQYSLFLSNNSVITFFNLKNDLEVFSSDLNKYKEKNNILISEIRNIKKNKNSLEIFARENFGYIKKNEIFFQIIRNEH